MQTVVSSIEDISDSGTIGYTPRSWRIDTVSLEVASGIYSKTFATEGGLDVQEIFVGTVDLTSGVVVEQIIEGTFSLFYPGVHQLGTEIAYLFDWSVPL